MSRYDYRDPGTDPAYCDPLHAEDDIDVPDFDAPVEMPVVEGWTLGEGRAFTASLVIDPAEHAAHALIDALGTLDQEIAKLTDKDLERGNKLKKIMKRAWADVTRVTDNAGDKVDQIVERLR